MLLQVPSCRVHAVVASTYCKGALRASYRELLGLTGLSLPVNKTRPFQIMRAVVTMRPENAMTLTISHWSTAGRWPPSPHSNQELL